MNNHTWPGMGMRGSGSTSSQKGAVMSLKEELAVMIAAEEKSLGVGSEEFMKRHQEIMEHIDSLMKKGEDKGETVYRSERGS